MSELHDAAKNSDIDEARKLLENGADVNERNKNLSHYTPLHIASVSGNTELAKFLIYNGADVNAVDVDNETPLHRASVYGNTKVAKVLIDNGADVNAVDMRNRTPLDRAKEEGNDEIAKLLEAAMEKSEDTTEPASDIQTTNDPDFTHHMLRCIETGQTEMLRSLLKAVSETSYKIPFSALLEKSIDEADSDALEIILPYSIRNYQHHNEPIDNSVLRYINMRQEENDHE